MFGKYRKRRRTRVEILPMIDIMFYLVLFFMVFGTSGLRLRSFQTTAATPSDLAHHIMRHRLQSKYYNARRFASEITSSASSFSLINRVVIVKADKSVS